MGLKVLVCSLSVFLLTVVTTHAFLQCNHRSRFSLRQIAATTSSPKQSQPQDAKATIARLRQEYQALQDKLRANLSETTTQQAMLDTQLRLIEVERQQQEVLAETAHQEMNDALQELRLASELKEQAEQETSMAIEETTWLESTMDQGHAELEAFLLAHAAHDLKQTDNLWQQAQVKRLEALSKEVRAKDLLWFLVQKEENLQTLQLSKDTKALQKWAEHELPKHESIVQVLREKLDHHDLRTSDSVPF